MTDKLWVIKGPEFSKHLEKSCSEQIASASLFYSGRLVVLSQHVDYWFGWNLVFPFHGRSFLVEKRGVSHEAVGRRIT
jgi:hypothetical protein